MGDFGHAGLAGLGDPGPLRARAEEAMAGLEIDARPGAAQVGVDGSGTIRVTVDSGGAVSEVSIGRRWRDRIGGAGLGAAVLSAYRRAEEKRAVAGERAAGKGGGAAPAPSLPDIDDEGWLDSVWASLDESRRRIDRLRRPRAETPAAERTVPGPGGYVRLRAVGGAVTEVLVDAVDVAERTPEKVAGDVRAAFAEVRRSSRDAAAS